MKCVEVSRSTQLGVTFAMVPLTLSLPATWDVWLVWSSPFMAILLIFLADVFIQRDTQRAESNRPWSDWGLRALLKDMKMWSYSADPGIWTRASFWSQTHRPNLQSHTHMGSRAQQTWEHRSIYVLSPSGAGGWRSGPKLEMDTWSH